ncbi:MAG: phosphodiester glycosidase family protein [Burkholderiaceae bacterium]
MPKIHRFRMRSAPCRWLATWALLLGLAGCAQVPHVADHPSAEAAWSAVGGQAGLLYERDASRPGQVLHWLRLDLQDPALRLELTPPQERGRPLDGFSGSPDALAVLNASFFSKTFEPRGLTMSQGEAWSPVMADQASPLIACDKRPRCGLQLQPPYALSPETWMAVAGTPWLIRDGRTRLPDDDATCPAFCAMTHPRTAAGLDASGRYLTLVLAEGRRGEVAGLRLAELAALMAARGVHQAFNLDGGGSSSLLLEGCSVMARPFNEPALRPLANAIVIRRVTVESAR